MSDLTRLNIDPTTSRRMSELTRLDRESDSTNKLSPHGIADAVIISFRKHSLLKFLILKNHLKTPVYSVLPSAPCPYSPRDIAAFDYAVLSSSPHPLLPVPIPLGICSRTAVFDWMVHDTFSVAPRCPTLLLV